MTYDLKIVYHLQVVNEDVSALLRVTMGAIVIVW